MPQPLIKTKNKAIVIAANNTSSKELATQEKAVIKMCQKITKGNLETTMVLYFMLRELPKLGKGEKFGFDFGTKKEWELKRIK